MVSLLLCSGSRRNCEQMLMKRRKRRKKAAFLIMAFCGAMAASSVECVWMRTRSQEWWDHDVNNFTETDFIQNFRMSRATFQYICQRLSTRLSREDTQFRRPISLRKRVGVGLYLLSSDVKVALNPTWLFTLRSHCKTSDLYPI